MRTSPRLRALLGILLTYASSVTSAQSPQAAPISLELRDVLARALGQNPLVDAAMARVRAAEGGRILARSFSNPLFTYQVENTTFSGGTPRSNLDRETSLYATLPLEPLFQRQPRVRGAEADVRAARADLETARRTVALDAAHAFYRVALAQTTVDGAADIRDRLAELVEYTRARVNEGMTSEGELIRAQVEVDRADAALSLAEAERVRAIGELSPYLGAKPTPAARVQIHVDSGARSNRVGATGKVVTALRPVDDYVERARAGRPELVAVRARADVARAQTTYERTLGIRQLGATLGEKRVADVSTMIAGISLPIPLFDQNRGGVQRASAEAAAAELEAAWRERQIVAEVTAAHEAASLLTAQRARLAQSAIARAEEARTIALTAYREGASSLLQVIDATRTLADIRNAFYRILIDEREAFLQLDIVSGADLTAVSTNSQP